MKGTSSHLITIHDMPLSSDTTHRVDYAPKEPDPEAHMGVHTITLYSGISQLPVLLLNTFFSI